MEPLLHQGDLVVVADRRRDYAAPGDIVLYHSAATNQLVLHRIVASTSQGFVTRGDNNWWVDPDLPDQSDVVGEYWVHIPSGGAAVGKLRSPLGLGLLSGVMCMLLVLTWDIASRDTWEDD